jgi:adenine-specific DNA-methyltransferase
VITKEQIKHTGATFTPKGLADFLSLRLTKYIRGNTIRALDPACGEGELLLSMGKRFKESGINFTLTGYDANDHYLNLAKARLIQFDSGNHTLLKADFLKVIDITEDQMSLNLFSSYKSNVNNSYDVVIANPPYVRTQILGSDQAQVIAKKFNLKGRVDLYYPFLMAMTESLKEGGILGVITSNRYLFTKSGESIRKYLSANFEILELIDLGDTKLFDAAVLPAIFIGRKKKVLKPSDAKFIKVYEELNGYNGPYETIESIYDILSSEQTGYFVVGAKRYKKTEGVLKYNISSGSNWEMLSTTETDWVSKIDKSAKCKVEDLFKVRVGIKTTADKVFISDQWDNLGEEKPEEELLKDLISQENIGSWSIMENSSLQVLYPHINKNGIKQTIDIEKYPKARKYFLLNEERLKARTYVIEAGREWFEIWVPHKPELWDLPKLVFPDISLTPRFYFDQGGRIVNGNCYWIVSKSKDELDNLLLIQGVANSKLMTKYHDLVFNNKLYSGRRRYFTQYVEKYPIPDPDTLLSNEIIALVKKLNDTKDLLRISQLENELEIKVAEAFGVEPVFTLD